MTIARDSYLAYWSDPANLPKRSDSRAEAAARLIRPGRSVLDLGCGSMALRRFLPADCRYTPADLKAWTAEVIVVDLNRKEFPAGRFDCVVLLGVVNYLQDLPWVFRQCRAASTQMVFSARHPAGLREAWRRRRRRWINVMSEAKLAAVLRDADWRIDKRVPLPQPGSALYSAV